MAQSELFDSSSKKLALVDITFELPEGFRKEDSFDAKYEASKEVIKSYLLEGWALFDAYSGGKDSSVKLCLVLNAMQEFVAEHGKDKCPPLAIMHSDTLLENPVIAKHTHSELMRIKSFVAANNLPVSVHVASPSLSENYLVNVIGGRTILSTAETKNRKCAVAMKVNPIQRLKKKIMENLGKDYGDKVLMLVGKRYDESASRHADMIANGERPDVHVSRSGENLLSPIAHFTLDDVYWCIGMVRNDMLSSYSDFESLVETYKAANGGECMINAVEGKAGSTSCAARYGCWVCMATADDKSMNTMVESDEFSFMRNLWALRNFMLASHNNPDLRTWLARTINDDGTVNIKPNSYSPEFTEQLLRMVLSVQVAEEEEAFELGIEPRFTLLTFEEVMAIECQWGRYGYHRGLEAIRIWKEVIDQGRLTLPPMDTDSLPKFPRLNDVPAATVPFVDEHYDSIHTGFRDVGAMVAGCEDTVIKPDGSIYTNARTSEEFSIDPEALMMFVDYEMDRALENYNNDNWAPGAGLHYLFRLGVVSINKASHSEYDRMLRMSNQIWRLGLRPMLNDPQKIVETLGQGDEFKLLRLF